MASKLQRNSVNITPVIPSGTSQRPQWNPSSVAAIMSQTACEAGQPPPPPASVPMARWSKVPAFRATTINKVTHPDRLLIDMTDEDLEKEWAAEGSRGGVALTSTTRNGRNPLIANKQPNIQPPSSSPMKSTLSHPAPLPAAAPVGASHSSWKLIAPKPSLDIKRVANGKHISIFLKST